MEISEEDKKEAVAFALFRADQLDLHVKDGTDKPSEASIKEEWDALSSHRLYWEYLAAEAMSAVYGRRLSGC